MDNLEKVEKECKKTPAIIYEDAGCIKECLIGKKDTPCFGVERYVINNGETEKLDAPCVYVVTEGNGILCGDGYEKPLKKGEYFFMPYSCKGRFTVKTKKNLTFAACIPPEV
jgi:mannose-6-phosphate isomerase